MIREGGRRSPSPLLVVSLALALGPAGCTTRLTPPEGPSAPVPVFVLDHGRHASLVLPGDEGLVIRYSYGDWRYYARNQTGFRSGAAAILWPTRSALGRRELQTSLGPDDVRRAVRVGVDTLFALQVEAPRVERLRSRLDSLHRAGRKEELLVNQLFDLEFVPHPRRYWLPHNSNQVVAGWLRELGVETRGIPVLSSWRVEDGGG